MPHAVARSTRTTPANTGCSRHRSASDGGSSIHSGVRVLVEGIPALGVAPGLPTEQSWPYSQYYRSQRQFEQAAKGRRDSAGPRDGARAVTRFSRHAGRSCSWGKRGISGPSGASTGRTLAVRSGAWTGCREAGGGHATEIIWAVEVRRSVVSVPSGIRTATAYYLMSPALL
jgi:hypothetical protein